MQIFNMLHIIYLLFLLYACSTYDYSFPLGRKVAIDASMSLYQFLIAVRNEGAQLTSVDGETTR